MIPYSNGLKLRALETAPLLHTIAVNFPPGVKFKKKNVKKMVILCCRRDMRCCSVALYPVLWRRWCCFAVLCCVLSLYFCILLRCVVMCPVVLCCCHVMCCAVGESVAFCAVLLCCVCVSLCCCVVFGRAVSALCCVVFCYVVLFIMICCVLQ